MDDEPLFREDALRLFRHRLVRRPEEIGQRFRARWSARQPAPYAAHLEADHAGAHDSQPLRHFGQRERARIVEHAHVVERHARQRPRRGTGRDDHVRRASSAGFGAFDLDVSSRPRRHPGERASAVEERHLVLLNRYRMPSLFCATTFVLAREHARHVDGEASIVDAVVGERMSRVVEVLGRLQQRLRRDAADIGARAAERGLASARVQSSMHAVWNPSCAQRMAATYPPGPAPITTTSKRSGVTVGIRDPAEGAPDLRGLP